jgi:hypothetical protein
MDPLSYTLYDVQTDALTLNNKSSWPNAAIYGDLGSGTSYGTFGMAVTVPLGGYSLTLNADAVADLNLALGASSTFFSIGGTLDAATVVPEPASLTLLCMGALGIAGYAGIRRKKQAVAV